MIIKNISIRNFRNIKKFDLDFQVNSSGSEADIKRGNFVETKKGLILPQISSLIGPNAVGKTNIMKSIHFLQYFANDLFDSHICQEIIMNEYSDVTKIVMSEIREKTKKLLKQIKGGLNPEKSKLFLSQKILMTESVFMKESNDSINPIEISLIF